MAGLGNLPSDPQFAAGVPTAPLLSDVAYIGLVPPTSGDMRAGGLIDGDDALPPPGAADDEEGLVGDIRV
jgi:hypothetical protein